MATVWDSRDFDLRDRSEALQETIRDNVVDVQLQLPSRAQDVRATVALDQIGQIQVCSVDAMPTVVTRTPGRARQDTEPSLFVTMQAGGTSMMIQHGREAVLGPGDLAVYATTDPYSLVFDSGVHSHFFRIPLEDLRLSPDIIRAVSARRLGHEDPVVRLTARFMRGLAEIGPGQNTAALGAPTVDLLRATLLDSAPAQQHWASRAEAETLALRVQVYIAQNLRDPLLSANSIAHAQHVSVRFLYAALAQAEMSLGDHIRTQRLNGARRDLQSPDLARWTVSAIGRKWCFPSAAHFSRVFRHEFGVTPLEWRVRQHPGLD